MVMQLLGSDPKSCITLNICQTFDYSGMKNEDVFVL
jgi:hypothetical protein